MHMASIVSKERAGTEPELLRFTDDARAALGGAAIDARDLDVRTPQHRTGDETPR
jgi:hypothetical protein